MVPLGEILVVTPGEVSVGRLEATPGVWMGEPRVEL